MLRRKRQARTSQMRAACLFGLALVFFAAPSRAQEQQFGVFFGGSLAQSRAVQGSPGETVQISAAYAAGLHYDHALWHSRYFEASVEAELTVVPPRVVRSVAVAVPRNYSALYLTPGLRLEFLPYARLRPWVVAGGGYNLFLQSQVLTNGQKYSVHVKNGAALDYGAGLDFSLWRARKSTWAINLFGQVRDFVSGNPELNVPLQSGVQHTVIASGGILFAK
jgi:outer membrane protein W